MNQTSRLAMVEKPHQQYSVSRQCRLLKVARSRVYYKPKPVSNDDLKLMKRIDEIYLKWPFYGSRRMVAELCDEGCSINRKHVRRLMRLMGIEAIYQKPNSSRAHPTHKKYPYLLRNMSIVQANQVWCADITYIPMQHGFVYLVAVMDWFSRKVLSWKMSITMETDFCVEAVKEAIEQYGTPDIFNTDQGVQFTATAFITQLETHGVQISMDGKARYLDNIFIERLWRSLKYEEVFIKAYTSVAEARLGIGAWLAFYNFERKHQALDYNTPHVFFESSIACGYDGQRKNVAHIPTGATEKAKKDSHDEEKGIRFTPPQSAN